MFLAHLKTKGYRTIIEPTINPKEIFKFSLKNRWDIMNAAIPIATFKA